MSNTIKVKRGATKPTKDDLEEYELGYSTTEKQLYIKDNNSIIELSSSISNTSNIRVLPFNYEVGLEDFIVNQDYLSKENYPYYYDISVEGVKATEIPIIIFRPDTTMEASFFVEAKDGIITIYASDKIGDSTTKIQINYIILIDTE